MSRFFDGFEGLLVDMDGVLYDSMKGHTLAWKMMMDELGVRTERDEFYLYEGMTGKETINLIFQRVYGRKATAEEAETLYHRKTEIFRSFAEPSPMSGASRMLAAFERAGLRRVLVTGSAQGSLLKSLDRDYPGVFPADRRVTALDVKHGKPAPEPYLKGAAIAGADPGRCIVVENAPLGVRAGKSAGCFTVAVMTGPIPREEFEREGADMIFSSMDEFADWVEATALRRGVEVTEAESPAALLNDMAKRLEADKYLVVTDENVGRLWLPSLDEFTKRDDVEVATVAAGEACKSLDEVATLWKKLSDEGFTRRSVVINFGGGSVTDMGGFAASTFKRGVRYVNVATTLLAMADAAVGGKTGIDFGGKKNEVGAFRNPERVIVSGKFLETLRQEELMSGMGEIVKTAMLESEEFYSELPDVYEAIRSKRPGYGRLAGKMAARAAAFKERVVNADPKEQGYRKILNLGHTAGHALESLAMRSGKALSHGESVAHGLYTALLISESLAGLEKGMAEHYRRTILSKYYRPLPFRKEEIGALIEIMGADKKNRRAGEPEFVLLRAPGRPVWGIRPGKEIIAAALEKTLSKG